MKKFVINLVRHPGTWIFLALLMVIIAAAIPFASVPILIIAAALISVAALASIHFFFTDLANRTFASFNHFYAEKKYMDTYIENNKKVSAFLLETFLAFAEKHPIQLTIILIGAALVITAFILTIGFLTGGFGFMAPVFAWLSMPFIAAAGSHISATALVFTTLILAAINLPNTLKRFSAWIDSFKYDFLAWAETFKNPTKYYNKYTTRKEETVDFWQNLSNLMYEANKYHDNPNGVTFKDIKPLLPAVHKDQFNEIINGVHNFCYDCRTSEEEQLWWENHENLRDHVLFKCYSYTQVISSGMSACIKNSFSSPYAEKCEETMQLR
jgi:hypothetical protein